MGGVKYWLCRWHLSSAGAEVRLGNKPVRPDKGECQKS